MQTAFSITKSFSCSADPFIKRYAAVAISEQSNIIVGQYIARIYDESKNRPIYVVRETINFSKASTDSPNVREKVYS
ncbi:hypothetical protein PMEGAPR236_15540 [Priestia megaterium]